MTPEVGRQYRLKANVGNEAEGLHLTGGELATVDVVVQPGEEGHPTGGVVMAFADRHWGISFEQFDEHFEEVA